MSPSIVMHDPQMQAGTGQIHRISSDQESLLESRRTTIVSIDLGTTFSAIASAANIDAQYFEIDDLILPPSRVNAQKRYQDARASKKREEVPSVLAYDPITGKPYFGLEVQTALNRGIITEVDKLELLKLLVARRSLPTDTRKSASLEELQQRISKVRRLDPNTGIRSSKRPSIIQMLSDCLSCLWRNALWDLGLTYTPEVVRSWDIRLILCIPAIWHLGEENIMRQAAAMANLPPPDFVFEPEGAAGLYFAEKPEEVDINDIFVTCDAGGGTVDLITYLPSQVQPLHVQELVTGSGGPCGSFNLNKDFRAALPELLSDVLADILHDMDVTADEFYDIVLKEFEEKKKDFNGMDLFGLADGNIYLDINGIKLRQARHVILRRNQMVIRRETAMAIFEKTMVEVRNLVREQITQSHQEIQRNGSNLGLSPNAKIKFIVLVGGFGGNPHLQDWLKKEFYEDASMGYPIPLVFPDGPATAIARGAILRATNRSFVSVRRSRWSFGFIQHDIYDPILHKYCSPRFDEFDDMDYADNRIHWLVSRNDQIPRKGFSKTWDSRRTLSMVEGDFEIIQVLYGSRTYVPDGTSLYSVIGRKHIQELGELKADMSEFPDWGLFERRPARFGDLGVQCLEFEYRLRITVDECQMTWEILLPPRGVFPEGESHTWDDSTWFSKAATLDLNPYIN